MSKKYDSYKSFLIFYLLPIVIKIIIITIFKFLIKKTLIPMLQHNNFKEIKISKKRLFTLVINLIIVCYISYYLLKTLKV
jgi:hypothetical protein